MGEKELTFFYTNIIYYTNIIKAQKVFVLHLGDSLNSEFRVQSSPVPQIAVKTTISTRSLRIQAPSFSERANSKRANSCAPRLDSIFLNKRVEGTPP